MMRLSLGLMLATLTCSPITSEVGELLDEQEELDASGAQPTKDETKPSVLVSSVDGEQPSGGTEPESEALDERDVSEPDTLSTEEPMRMETGSESGEPSPSDASSPLSNEPAPVTGESDALDSGVAGETDTLPVEESPAAIAVAVGYGTRRVRSVDGIEWTDFVEVDPMGGDDDNLLRGVGYGNGLFVAVGGAGNGLTMVSEDGVTWTDENRENGSFLSDVVALGDAFVAAGGNGLRVRSLDGGRTWTDSADYYSGHFRALAVGNERVVAVGHSYGETPDVGLITSTEDGATWTEIQAEGEVFGSIAFGSAVFVAMGDNGRCSTSTDGSRWTTRTLDGAEASVAFANGEFLVPAGEGYYKSADGEDWSLAPAAARSIAAFLRGTYLSLGWPASVERTTDLDQWSRVFSVEGPGLTQIAVGVPRALLAP